MGALIGHLSRVVRAGRTFLCCMIDLSSVPKDLNQWVRLNKGFQSDLHWWAVFLEGWNGVSIFNSVVHTPDWTSPTWRAAFLSVLLTDSPSLLKGRRR